MSRQSSLTDAYHLKSTPVLYYRLLNTVLCEKKKSGKCEKGNAPSEKLMPGAPCWHQGNRSPLRAAGALGSPVFWAAVAVATLAQARPRGRGGAKAACRPAPPSTAVVTSRLAVGLTNRKSRCAIPPQCAAARARSRRGVPSSAPPLALLPHPTRASAACVLGPRLSSQPRRVPAPAKDPLSGWPRCRRCDLGIVSSSGGGTVLVCREAASRAPEGPAPTAKARLTPEAAASAWRPG